MTQCDSLIEDSKTNSVRLSPEFCARFRGVCAECPNNPRRTPRSKFKPETDPRLPPLAGRAIAALARCRKLTKRESDVLVLCCGGQKNSAIASTLGVSASAVRRHLRNLHKKTNTSDKAELILNLWHACRACQDTIA